MNLSLHNASNNLLTLGLIAGKIGLNLTRELFEETIALIPSEYIPNFRDCIYQWDCGDA